MRILALVPGGIEDQFLFFPTLEDLKKKYPQAVVDVIVEPRAKPAYRVCPHVDEVLVFDYKDRNGLADYLNLLGIIRDREYEAAISTGQRWTISLLLWLNGIPRRVGYKTNTSWFISHPVPLKTGQYDAYRYHDLLQGLGIQSPCPVLKINIPQEDIDWAAAEQQRLELQADGYILLYKGSPGTENTYPVAKWQQLVDDIEQKQPNLSIVLLQDSQEGTWVGEIRQAHPNLKLTQPDDIGKLAAIIAAANLLICPDSVPMQLAAAVGTYTIALLGATETAKRLPSDYSDHYLGIQSPTGKIADIQPEIVLQGMRGSRQLESQTFA